MKNKVLFLPKWYPNQVVPLSGNFVRNHAVAASAFSDIAVVYVRPVRGNEVIKPQTTYSEEVGFPEIHVYFKAFGGMLKYINPVLYFIAQRRGYRLLTNSWGQPDLIHVHVFGRNAMFALIQKIFKGIPFLITEHWSGYLTGKYKGFKKLVYPVLANHSNGVSAVSDPIANVLDENGLTPVKKVIPNVVDVTIFKPMKEIQRRRKVLFVADFRKWVKNLDGLIEAAKLLKQEEVKFKLNIVGDGPDRKFLEDEISGNGLSEQVKLLGTIEDRTALARLMNESALLTLPSRMETFGVVVAEALSCGIPVAVTDLEAFSGIMDKDFGRIVPLNDAEALAFAWKDILDNFERYDREKMHRHIADRFSYEAVGKVFADWYESVLK